MNFIMSLFQAVLNADLFSQLTVGLTPLIVFGVTWLVRQISPTLSGAATVGIVVPVLTALTVFVSYEAGLNANNVILQSVLGLASVFVNEFIRQMKQPKDS